MRAVKYYMARTAYALVTVLLYVLFELIGCNGNKCTTNIYSFDNYNTLKDVSPEFIEPILYERG